MIESKWYIPDTTFYMHEYAEGETGGCSIDGVPSFEWSIKRASDLFAGKKVVIFALPGAFTPTCSSQQLPMYDVLADEFKKHGIEEVWCTAVNDAFVMRSWSADQNLKNVKMLPDGNGDFAKGMDMLVDKSNLGFGKRSWRYAIIVDDMSVEHMFCEDHWSSELSPVDPYGESAPETVLKYLEGKTIQGELPL
jgi:peroxiredoxin (alkyl hydroperoxide reductase subunit C)